MKKMLLTLAAALICTAALSAHQTPPPPPPPPPPAQTPPTPPAPPAPPAAPGVSLTGNWNLSLDAGQGPMDIAVTFKVDGKKITGTLSSPMGDAALEGELVDRKATFSIDFNGTSITWVGTLKDADNMTGTLSGPMGEIPFTGKRVKS